VIGWIAPWRHLGAKMPVGWNRREFIALLGGAAASWPLSARGEQQLTTPVVGFLDSGSPGPYAGRMAGFRQGLNDTGFVEGKDVAIEYRWAEGNYDRLPQMALDLVRREVSVIVAGGGIASAPVARAATSTIPIVFLTGVDPVAAGLVTSLARPGGNVTGVSFLTQELGAKRLGLLNVLEPNGTVIALLLNSTNPGLEAAKQEVQKAAQVSGRQIHVFGAHTPQEIDAAFGAIAREQAGALLVLSDPFFSSSISQKSRPLEPRLAFLQSIHHVSMPRPAALCPTEPISETSIAKPACTSGEFFGAPSLRTFRFCSRPSSSWL